MEFQTFTREIYETSAPKAQTRSVDQLSGKEGVRVNGVHVCASGLARLGFGKLPDLPKYKIWQSTRFGTQKRLENTVKHWIFTCAHRAWHDLDLANYQI